MFNKDLEELKNKQATVNNTVTEIKNMLQGNKGYRRRRQEERAWENICDDSQKLPWNGKENSHQSLESS